MRQVPYYTDALKDSEKEATLPHLYQRPERVKPYTDKSTPAFRTCREQMEACTPEWPHLGDIMVTWYDENLGARIECQSPLSGCIY